MNLTSTLRFPSPFRLLGCMLLCAVGHGQARSSAKPAEYTGCVTPLPQASDTLVLSTVDSCYLLSGSVSPSLAGHQVQLSAVLFPQQGMQPITLQVKSVLSVKAACSQTCKFQPPGTRGLGPKDKPGREGGTPGLTTSPQP